MSRIAGSKANALVLVSASLLFSSCCISSHINALRDEKRARHMRFARAQSVPEGGGEMVKRPA